MVHGANPRTKNNTGESARDKDNVLELLYYHFKALVSSKQTD